MTLQCNHCGVLFLSNHALYKHKSLTHPKSSILSDEASISHTAKRPAEDDDKEISKLRKINPKTFSDTSFARGFDGPQEKFMDSLSRPELLSLSSPDRASSYNRENNSESMVNWKSDHTGGDLVVSKNSNSDYASTQGSYEHEMIDSKCGVNEDQIGIGWYKRKLSNLQLELREKCDEISRIQEYYQKQMIELTADHMKEKSRHEEEWAAEIKCLNSQIQALKDGEEDTGDLTMAIFNISAIREIIEIQQLIKNHQIGQVLQDHLPTLKNILLSLSSGVLPLCQPQRSKVTNEQRMLVEQLQSATRSSAKRILRDKEAEIISLFEIVKYSLELAIRSFNRFSTF